MGKPITEWGSDEVKAMFGGLPDGSVIVRQGDSLLVANVFRVDFEGDYEFGRSDHKMVCHLKRDIISHNHLVGHRLPEVNIDGARIKVAEALEVLHEIARNRA